ncbi:hypothetical protein [Microbacterium sp. A93]|uniref:hypothetical protein n=1 Tax=Microbacterium sp. A93 TaxID=3450716 RepID=UPI003F43D2AC
MSRAPLLVVSLLSLTALSLAGCAEGQSPAAESHVPAQGSEPGIGERTEPTAEPGWETVDPGDFARSDDSGVYVFESPTGNLACGIDPEGATGFLAGCHARDVVENLPSCDDPDANGPWTAITRDGTAEAGCQREGVFFASGARTLEYGQALEVGDVHCESSEDGMACSLADGPGFTASRAAFTPTP